MLEPRLEETPELARADALFAKVGPAAQLSPTAVDRLRYRLHAQPRRSRKRVLVLALAGAGLLLVNAAFAAALWYRQSREPARPATVVPAPVIAPVAPVAPVPSPPTPVVEPAPRPARHAVPRTVTPAPEPAPPPPLVSHDSELAAESAALAPALRAMRQDREPEGALRLLDAYRARYPHGLLDTEAALLEADALVAADRRPEARAVLEALERRHALDPDRAEQLRRLREDE